MLIKKLLRTAKAKLQGCRHAVEMKAIDREQECLKFRSPGFSEGQYAIHYHRYCESVQWLSKTYFPSPTGGTANSSLSYLIVRTLNELKPKNVIEFGAGLSTQIIADYVRSELLSHATTVESDSDWAKMVDPHLSNHCILKFPLTQTKVHGRTISYYSNMPPAAKYDFILIDGPAASSPKLRYNRTGIIDQWSKVLSEEFVIIIDDASRAGEQLIVKSLLSYLDERGITYKKKFIHALNSQFVAATPKFYSVIYY